MKIYTKTGDEGTTSTLTGERVPKTDMRIEAAGSVDELNSLLGVVLTHARDAHEEDISSMLLDIQHDLFSFGATLSLLSLKDMSRVSVPRINESHVLALESKIDSVTSRLSEQKSFLLPNGTPTSCWLHLARTVTRRAERDVLRLASVYSCDPVMIQYLNRLSDLLYVLARFANKETVPEQPPIYR